MNKKKEVESYINLLVWINGKNIEISNKLIEIDYEVYKGTQAQISEETDTTKWLMYNALCRRRIMEFYEIFMKRENLSFLTELTSPEDKHLKIRIEELSVMADSYLKTYLYYSHNRAKISKEVEHPEIKDYIRISGKIYKEFEEISEYIKSYKLKSQKIFGIFNGKCKIDTEFKKLSATYPSLLVIGKLLNNMNHQNN